MAHMTLTDHNAALASFKRLIEQGLNKNTMASGNPSRFDNRTGVRFGGFLHEAKPVIEADNLWDKLQEQIAAQKAHQIREENTHSSPVKINSYRLGDCFAAASSQIDNYAPDLSIGEFSLTNRFMSVGRVFPPDSVMWELYNPVTPDEYMQILNVDTSRAPLPQPIPIETDEAFHARSQYRYKHGNRNVDEAWDALQKTLKPSLAEEDVLGDFDTWMSRTPSDIQYLMIGDTNHSNNDIDNWIWDGAYLASLKEQGFNDLVMEWSIKYKPVLDDYFNNHNSEIFISPKIDQLCKMAKHHGVRLHAFDEHIGTDFISKVPNKRFGYERFRHDQIIKQHVTDTLGDRKSAFIYGAAHFKVQRSLVELLGKDRCRSINLHADLNHYREAAFISKINARYQIPYTYLIKENTAISNFGDYGRRQSLHNDEVTCSIMMGLQEEEIVQFLERYQTMYSGTGAKKAHGIKPADVLKDIYWHLEAQKSKFYQSGPLKDYLTEASEDNLANRLG